MAIKEATIVTPGGALRATVAITPQTTAGAVLKNVGLGKDFFLSPATGDRFFQPNDLLDSLVKDGDTLYANPWAKVGSPAVLMSAILAAAGALVTLGLILVAVAQSGKKRASTPASTPHTPARTPVQQRIPETPAQTHSSQPDAPGRAPARPAEPHLKPTAWRKSGHTYSGEYSVKGHRFKGRASFQSAWDCSFRICAPDDLIEACGEHRRCFLRKRRSTTPGRMWFEVHFQEPPESLRAGIVAIETTLSQARTGGGTAS